MKHFFFLLALALIPLIPIESLQYLQFDAGLHFIGNSEPDSAPSPFLPTVGMTFPILDHPFLTWESSFLLFGTYYQYENNRANPVEQEHRDFLVPAVLGDTRFGAVLKLGKFSMGGNIGLALLLRVPIPLFSDISSDWGPIAAYFYAMARFFYPESEVYASYQLDNEITLKVAFRSYYPLFNLWTGEQLPFIDQYMFNLLVGVVWNLPGKT